MSTEYFLFQAYPNSISGLKVGVASNTTLTIGIGAARDTTNSFDINVKSTLTLNSAVNGVNGLDTGTIAANSCYAVFAISDPTNKNTPAGLLSLSPTAPIMPSLNGVTYQALRRVGWAFTDGSSHFIPLTQVGSGVERTCWYDADQTVLTGGTSTTFVNISFTQGTATCFVPPSIRTTAILSVDYSGATAGNRVALKAGDSSTANGIVQVYASVALVNVTMQVQLMTGPVAGVQAISYKVTNGSDSTNVYVDGFYDYL